MAGGRGTPMQRLAGRKAQKHAESRESKRPSPIAQSCFSGLSWTPTLSPPIGQEGKPSFGGAGLGLGTLGRSVDPPAAYSCPRQDRKASPAGTWKLPAPWPRPGPALRPPPSGLGLSAVKCVVREPGVKVTPHMGKARRRDSHALMTPEGSRQQFW